MTESSARPPAISVVMPTLNQAGFIAESVRSVMAQRVDALELVVADGGSTDGTQDLLADLAAEHPGRLRWASTADSGPAQALNAAVARARAPIIGWLNSDDLYMPGAVARALAHFERHPDHVMVYGEADHIDAEGRRIDRYPTLPPETPLSAYVDGCHICQPSAFFRRAAFDELGGMDTSLGAAFDFDLWLRLLKRFPGRVGFVDALQAGSRLHPGAITMRMRERVAIEGITVIHRHLGPAPLHWLLTHADELLASHPFHREPLDLHARMRALADRLAPCLDRDAPRALEEQLRQHRGARLVTEHFGCSVHGDGWTPPVCHVRLWQTDPPVRLIRLHCRHAAPRGGALDIEVGLPEEQPYRLEVVRPGPFVVEIPIDERRAGARIVIRLAASASFVPAEVQRGSDDRRRLAFQVEDAELL